MTKDPEADYLRAKMDEVMRRIFPEDSFVPFERRYDWVKKISYEKSDRRDSCENCKHCFCWFGYQLMAPLMAEH